MIAAEYVGWWEKLKGADKFIVFFRRHLMMVPLGRWLNLLDGCFANSYLDKNLVWQGIVCRAVGNIVCEVSQFIGKHKQAVCIILIWLTLDAV
ncbi:hypothetical protein [Neisseria sp. S1]|uniref:hypothetical protein n=1 Tax=Neisseria sp. S1 TaxID=3318354 RepID=UPI003A87D1A5